MDLEDHQDRPESFHRNCDSGASQNRSIPEQEHPETGAFLNRSIPKQEDLER
jgi:hypothetical protein